MVSINPYTRKKKKEVAKAHRLIVKNILIGRIPKPTKLYCMCGKKAVLYHHIDYNRPLLIIPLCKRCHCRVHNKY